MDCPNCQTPNRTGANFCKNCGTLLLQSCPRCNNDLPENANHCDKCGLRLVVPPEYPWWAAGQPGTPLPASGLAEKFAQILPTTGASPAPTGAPAKPVVSLPQAAETQLKQYIPEELLAKLETARVRGEMVGERRVVTILFCDVMGSTAAAELLDPEEWTEIINGAFEQMIRPVYKYEGTVARLMGDGILAFFGAPITHEDEPQRAILTGLEIVNSIKEYSQQIKQRHGFDFNVRVGINTGLVVVGAVGSDLRMEYTALGDAINLAARMEQTALPGTVQVAQDTYKLTKSAFEFEALGGIQVKGKAEPVLAYRVSGRKAVSGRSRGIEGLYAEMVGRETELSTLQGVVSDLKQGIGRIVCILGEAGLGKSRLVSEVNKHFTSFLGTDGDWYETTSLSYETNQAYSLIQRLIRRIGGIAYNDPPQAVREKLGTLVEEFGEGERPRAKQLFQVLFGLESGPGVFMVDEDAFKRELFEVMDLWWRAIFSNRPAVLVFDDMHWSDTASIELLRQLMHLTGEIPLALICAMRSEKQAPAWQIKTLAEEEYEHRYIEMILHPLSDAESNELINRLLVNAELPDRLRANILEKVSGNPFFIEEIVKSLIDRGVVVPEERAINGQTVKVWRATTEGADFPLPDNLQSLLVSRIDRLEDMTRGTLQMASVIGRSFYHRVLAAIDEAKPGLEKRLGTLLRLDMIREAARVPEVEYIFRNPLTQEAVYQSILLKRRREFHRRVGEAIEILYPDRRESFFGLLAKHYALAGEREKSIQYSRNAARQAVSLFAYDDAIQNLQAALRLLEPHERNETRLVLLEDLGDIYSQLRNGEKAIESYREALQVGSSISTLDPHISVRINRKIVDVANEIKWSVTVDTLTHVQESVAAARTALQQSLETLLAGPPHLETVRALVALSTDAWRLQEPPDLELAQRYARAAVEMAEQLDSQVERSKALGALATVLDGRSFLREHLQVAQRRLEICRSPEFEDVSEHIDALRSVGAAQLYIGEYEQALTLLQETEDLAMKAQVVVQQGNALVLQAQCLFRLDRWDEVLAKEEKWRDLERRYPRERVGEP